MRPSRQHDGRAPRPVQRQAQRSAQNPPQQSQTGTKKTAKKVVTRPDGRPVEVIQTEEHIVKKTMWTRVMTGTQKVTRSGTWKNTGKATTKAVKKLIPHSAKHGKDSSGFNLSYYRKSYFLLDKQTQYDLYMSGFAPKMTKREVSKLRSSSRHGHTTRTYKPETVMYDAHISPAGYEAPLKDLVAEAKAAKRRAIATAKKRKQAAAAANGDALPAHPTPAAYTKIQVQSRLTKAQQQQARLKQQQQQKLRQGGRQTQKRSQQPLRQAQQIGVAVSQGSRQQQQRQGLRQGQARVRQSVGVPVSGTGGRRVAGQSVAGSSRG